MIHVLLIDDESELRTLVSDYLHRFGMQVVAVPDAASMRRTLLADHSFDVLLLDLMLPDGNGLELCRWVRARSTVPVIMLTAQGDPMSRIIGLEVGADDYLPKPFEPRELVARINAVLRRTGPARAGAASGGEAAPSASTVRFNGWTFDRLTRQLIAPGGVQLALSSAEYRLLSAFVAHPRQVLSRDRLLDLSRAPGVEVTDRSIDLAVSRLRQKLGDPALQPTLIRTVRGAGYLFDAVPGG